MLMLIDKPKGITSHDVIDKLRKITGIRKVGHAGTLDPNATGLLIVGVGRENTKKLGSIAKDTSKTYVADIFLGETRDTDDVEGEILKQVQDDAVVPTMYQLKEVLKKFKGDIEQIPPIYSAIKKGGKKAYELARKGKEVVMDPRKVTIHSIKVLDYVYPELKIECDVSSGTYIRALARDIGEELGSGAYLKDLRRIKIGDYSIESAITLDKLSPDNWEEYGI